MEGRTDGKNVQVGFRKMGGGRKHTYYVVKIGRDWKRGKLAPMGSQAPISEKRVKGRARRTEKNRGQKHAYLIWPASLTVAKVSLISNDLRKRREETVGHSQ